MQPLVCLMIFSCLLATVFAEKTSSGYQADVNVQTKTCKNKDRAFKATNVPTSLTCSSICASDVDCKSFFYFPKSLRCDGCKQTYSTDGQLKGAGEQTVYYKSKAKEGYLYNGCFIQPCDIPSGQKCSYKLVGALADVNVASCFAECDPEVSTIALLTEVCYCDVEYDETLTADCDLRCSGNPNEMCGGNYAMSVYSKYQ